MNREKEQERVRKEKQKERSLRKETEKLKEAAASLNNVILRLSLYLK